MDTGEGWFERFYASTPTELQEIEQQLQQQYPKHGGTFREGEIVEIKGSRFEISEIIQNGLKLRLLPKEPAGQRGDGESWEAGPEEGL